MDQDAPLILGSEPGATVLLFGIRANSGDLPQEITPTPIPPTPTPVTPTPIPPTPQPTTEEGTVLQLGETWVSQKLRLTLDVGYLASQRSYISYRYDLTIENTSDETIQFVFDDDMLVTTTGSGCFWEKVGDPLVGKEIVLQPGESIEVVQHVKTGCGGSRYDAEHIVVVRGFADIERARWGFQLTRGEVWPYED